MINNLVSHLSSLKDWFVFASPILVSAFSILITYLFNNWKNSINRRINIFHSYIWILSINEQLVESSLSGISDLYSSLTNLQTGPIYDEHSLYRLDEEIRKCLLLYNTQVLLLKVSKLDNLNLTSEKMEDFLETSAMIQKLVNAFLTLFTDTICKHMFHYYLISWILRSSLTNISNTSNVDLNKKSKP